MPLQDSSFAKDERISLRIDSHTKALIEQAAAIDHRSLTGFIVACAKEQAERLIERETSICLKKREWDQFMSVLENAPKPNAALKRLLQKSSDD